MNPAAGVPLHFTVEALGLGVAGVTLGWATLARRWTVAGPSFLLVVAQVLYAGQFFAADSAGAAVAGAVRIAGVVLLGAAGAVEADAALIAPSCALLAGASIWRLAGSAGPASLPWGERVLEIAGFAVLGVWAWRRASTSVRSRIVAAFVAVLGAAVVVMGGAAARVSVTNAIDNAQARLDAAARDQQRFLDARATDLANRAALGSAIVSQLGPSARTVATLRAQAFPDANLLALVRGNGPSFGDADLRVTASAPVRQALSGSGATGVVPGGALLIAAQPVLPRSSGFALVVGQRLEGGGAAADVPAGTTVQLLTSDGGRVRLRGTAPRPVSFAQAQPGTRITLGGRDVLVSGGRLDLSAPPAAAVSLVLPVSDAADAATSFPRALVGGVLVAALLAVVLALWLASRITRPILSLADEAERVKSDFLATISHELRTPLTPIRGYTDLLRRGRVPRRRQEVYLDEITEAARRMERIVTLLVEVAALEAGRYTLDTEPVPAGDIVAAAVQRWEPRSRRHRFTLKAPKSLPRVDVDRRAVDRVLDELLDNAVKFSPDGGEIEVSAARKGDAVVLSIADRGIGLGSDALRDLSAAFAQAEPGATRRFGGLGLGLTFAAGVLAAHGTSLDVEGTKGTGTTFSFTLPAVGMVSRVPGRAPARAKRDDLTK